MHFFTVRIREAKVEGTQVVDVDGSYLSRKHQELKNSGVDVVPLDPPSIPLVGWEKLLPKSYMTFSDKIPKMLAGIYTQ